MGIKKMVSYEEMTDEQMMEYLMELSSTVHFQALMRYNRIKEELLLEVLIRTDPYKEPTKIADAQGMRKGLYMFEEDILQEVERKHEEDKEKEKK